MHVQRCYEVKLPERGTDFRKEIEQAIRESMPTEDDAKIVIDNDEAVAVWLSYQLDAGNFTGFVEMCDTVVVEDHEPETWRVDEGPESV